MRNYKTMPKRGSQAILCMYANYADGTRINLVSLRVPYSDGTKYLLDDDTGSDRKIKGFSTLKEAMPYFDLMVKAAAPALRKMGTV